MRFIKTRLLLAAIIGVLALAGATTEAQSPPSDQQTTATTPVVPVPEQKCVHSVRFHNSRVRAFVRYSSRGGDFRARPVTRHRLWRLGQIRRCAKSKAAHQAMVRYFHQHMRTWHWYRHLDAITVYGKWAVPSGVVMAESGGDFGATNPGGCGGPGCYGAYQIGVDHWNSGRVCAGLGYDPASQHECAYRVLQSEGSGAWSTW